MGRAPLEGLRFSGSPELSEITMRQPVSSPKRSRLSIEERAADKGRWLGRHSVS